MSEENKLAEVLSRDPPAILNKSEYYHLYQQGFLGNKPLSWNSYADVLKSHWRGEVCIRNRRSSSQTIYNIPFNELERVVKDLCRDGQNLRDLTFNQSLPDDKLLIQGEVIYSPIGRQIGLNLNYSDAKKPMKISLRERELFASGLDALLLLKKNLNSASFEDLQELFSIFPNSAIEFSAYSINIGNLPGRNTLIWEVRNY